MTYQESFEALKAQLEALSAEEVRPPVIPVDVAVQEAENLYQVAKEDAEALATAGITAELIESLPVRIDALRYVQGLWTKDYGSRTDSEAEWKEVSVQAYALRDELLHTFRFAFRKQPAERSLVSKISKGSGHADLIQDLMDLSVLGKAHPEALAKVGFDATKLDTAEELSNTAGTLLGEVNEIRGSSWKPSKDIRDRANSYLKMAVDEIRETGKFVFWKNEDKERRYTSDFYRKKRVKAQEAKTEA
ncbi:hypothetical protein FUAX_11800 [Fulvitalea axinellae]|uniref:Uncharacterized protein n=1 Tax=Fulvitalea axinellae TaxID=1182444 RepID=A0AAU9CL33_9BACT|nr:hypothetical protein FUAX_11800 [Fulvitalea axinellae]